MKRDGVRPSVRPTFHHSPAARRCDGFAAERRPGMSIDSGDRPAFSSSSRAAARRAAANAGSATLSAYVGSRSQTCYILQRRGCDAAAAL